MDDGGIEHALFAGTADIADVLDREGYAVDLGAGFGMHAIPLATAGYRVLAIDSSAHLIAQLRSFGAGLPIESVIDDLLCFPAHMPPDRKADLVLCMGDTLTHLPTRDAIEMLADAVCSCLSTDGRFIATFRNYTTLPAGDARFIPLRSEDECIHLCFIEEAGEHVRVHDILHQRKTGCWSAQLGSYLKLRLSPDDLGRIFSARGLNVSLSAGPRGMTKLTAIMP